MKLFLFIYSDTSTSNTGDRELVVQNCTNFSKKYDTPETVQAVNKKKRFQTNTRTCSISSSVYRHEKERLNRSSVVLPLPPGGEGRVVQQVKLYSMEGQKKWFSARGAAPAITCI